MTTTTTLYRATATLDTITGRTIYGRLVPFGESATVDDGAGPYVERFARGAFARSIDERGTKVRLFIGHDDRRLPIGRATLLEERADGLFGEFEIAATRDGDDALEAVRSGLVDSFSIGFRPIADRRDSDGAVVRTEVALREVSLVAFPAYAGALVGGVRSDSPCLSRADAHARLAPYRKHTDV